MPISIVVLKLILWVRAFKSILRLVARRSVSPDLLSIGVQFGKVPCRAPRNKFGVPPLYWIVTAARLLVDLVLYLAQILMVHQHRRWLIFSVLCSNVVNVWQSWYLWRCPIALNKGWFRRQHLLMLMDVFSGVDDLFVLAEEGAEAWSIWCSTLELFLLTLIVVQSVFITYIPFKVESVRARQHGIVSTTIVIPEHGILLVVLLVCVSWSMLAALPRSSRTFHRVQILIWIIQIDLLF